MIMVVISGYNVANIPEAGSRSHPKSGCEGADEPHGHQQGHAG
jgi:hypothetical protein